MRDEVPDKTLANIFQFVIKRKFVIFIPKQGGDDYLSLITTRLSSAADCATDLLLQY